MDNNMFDTIVGDFYRAATGAIEWDQALIGVQAAFGARACILHTLDLASGQLIGLHSGGPDLADAMLSYLREYYLIDPRRQRVLALGDASLDRWLHCHEAFDDAYVARDRFFQHFLPAHGSRYNSLINIPIADTVATAFNLELPAERGPLDADEREVARRLGDHLREAMRAHQRTRSLMQRALAGHALLEAFPHPMWLIDDGRFITFENRAASAELDQATRVARVGNCLVMTRGRTDRIFLERFEHLRHAEHGTRATVDLRATSADSPVWLHLSVLIPGVVLGAFGQRPLILATLFDPGHVSALDPFALANLFGLTPTEAKVAARLADGSTAEQIGRLHGTAEATVRTQIRQVVAKLGAARTVDVVRMLRQGEALWASADRARTSAPLV
jgi:DNA-binding CsgD family transcriptional regulator/PAS domain-containing protein